MQRFSLILLIVSLSLGSCDFVKKINPFSKEADNSMEIYQRQQDSLQRAEALRVQQESARLEQAQADSIRMVQQQKEAERLRMERYHLVVGAFKTPDYARTFHNEILSQGHPSKILMSENDFHLVTIKSTDNYRSAVNDWIAIRNQGEHQEVWLYITD
jgi:cell division protein FtsN